MLKTFAIQSSMALAAVLMTGVVHAQTVPGTVVQAPTLSCTTPAGSGSFNVISWSVGGTAPQNSTGSGNPVRQRTQLGPFNLAKAFDECSPALFQALAKGTVMRTLTITDRERQPLTIQLQNAVVSEYVLSDGASNTGPSESISLVYDQITITNTANGSKFCFDITRNTSCP